MLNAYQVAKGDKVLLLGEGNFSFCRDFIIYNESLLGEELSAVEIIATCRENLAENQTEFKQNNISFIQSKGVIVYYNVDATSLKCHPIIKDQTYDKIIFNFPHVGGKMKIHLNRKLLRDFFSSACDVLDQDGCIVVALCDGQGGTGADKKQRNWNDSWQITEMAAQSDLILYKVEPFDVTCFPNYVNVGYRSLEKSFHCENAIVHLFRRQKPLRILQEDPETWMRGEGDVENLIVDSLEKNLYMPWSNCHSASSYIYQKLIEKFRTSLNFIELTPVKRYSLSTPSDGQSKSCEISSNLFDIYKSVTTDNSRDTGSCIVLRSLTIKKPVVLKEFAIPPVRCQVLIFGCDILSTLHLFLTDLLDLLDSKLQVYVDSSGGLVQNKVTLVEPNSDKKIEKDIIQVSFLPDEVSCYIIHIDELAEVLFEIKDWRSLWNGFVNFSSSVRPKFCPIVLYPKDYAFDLGLSVPLQMKNRFEEDFYLTLWLLAGDIIVKVEHLTTYEPTDRDLICYCYRITYKSHSAPLHRKRVIYFHEKIVARVVSRILQVNIT